MYPLLTLSGTSNPDGTLTLIQTHDQNPTVFPPVRHPPNTGPSDVEVIQIPRTGTT